MNEIVGGVIGALALIGIPLVAWIARRATREGRLLLRVEALGRAYVLMPVGEGRAVFEGHVNAAVSELNSWLDPENRRLRMQQRAFSVSTYVLGGIATVLMVPIFARIPELNTLAGITIGCVIAVVNLSGSWLIGRGAATKASLAAEAQRLQHERKRLEALKRGEPFAFAS
jgi:hypothetical protein